MADGSRSRYYNFDPGQYYAQTTVQNPFYNPLSPNPNVLGGLRQTINSIWAFREMQREQEEQRKQMDFEGRLNERELGLRERKQAFEEETTRAEAEERRKNKWTDTYEKFFGPETSRASLTEGGLKMAKAYGYDPASITDNQEILRLNGLALDQTADIAEKERREAKDTASATRAGNVGFITYHLNDVTERLKKIYGMQPEAWIPNPRYDKNDLKGMKKQNIPAQVPNPDKERLPFELQATQKVKDFLEAMSSKVAAGGDLTGEDRANILSLASDARYRDLYTKELTDEQVMNTLDMGLSPREVNKFFYEWKKAGGQGSFEQSIYEYLMETGQRQ